MTTIKTLDELHDSPNQHDRAEWFAKQYSESNYEMGEAQSFISGLCNVFGIRAYNQNLIRFEERINKKNEAGIKSGINRIDGFFPGLLLVEMKSEGKDLDAAYIQAYDYTELIADTTQQPRYILVSDFQNLRLYDRQSNDAPRENFKLSTEIKLAEFRLHIDKFEFLNKFQRDVQRQQEDANTKAAEMLAELHDAIKATGYEGKDLETLLVRILFCLFADDTGLFGEVGMFDKLLNGTREDGRDLFDTLDTLFDTLNTPDGKSANLPNQRPKNIYAEYVPFPYINGALFKGGVKKYLFDSTARKALIRCNEIDWSQISPDIFGSLFQAIMHHEGEVDGKRVKGAANKRREFGAHYTSEANILKVIDSLFLNALETELRKIKKDAKKLKAYLGKLRELNFFDPACGCGNFLVVTYREIRLLEEQAINALSRIKGETTPFPSCDVDQFHGIEIDPSAAQIATVALWLTDHQMNCRVNSNGEPYRRLPLSARANIVCANALQLDWNEVIPAEKCSYVMGNPPFLGKSNQSAAQKEDMALVTKSIQSAGVLDYVAAWYVKAARYIQNNQKTQCAFVSTNSITQGEQVGALWGWMLAQKIKIHFAHRTFRWNNEGRGVAAVHCIIVGFGLTELKNKLIYNYSDINSEPQAIKAKNINPYLVDAPDVLLQNRSKPISKVPEMAYGNKPVDGGNLLLSTAEKNDLLAKEPLAEKWIRPLLGADEFLNGKERWCLWLVGIKQNELNAMPEVTKLVDAVREMRLASIDPQAQKLAIRSMEFRDTQEPETYILIPAHSSERRDIVPMGFFDKKTITTNANFMLPNATLYHFGILTSTMHNAWMRSVAGRLESRYRYSNTIVYNNYPWPTPATEQKQAIEAAAQAVLDARALHEGKTDLDDEKGGICAYSLAWAYNPETMPLNLKNAHNDLDGAVDDAYGYDKGNDDAERVAFLFELYQKLINTNTETTTKPIKAISKKAKATP